MTIQDCIGMTLKSVEPDAQHRGLFFIFDNNVTVFVLFEEY